MHAHTEPQAPAQPAGQAAARPTARLYHVNTRVRAGGTAPPQLTRAAEVQLEQLREASRTAYADGVAAGERLGDRAGWWRGYLSGGVTGFFAGALLVLVPFSLGYASVIGRWFS